jgi:hypothetical protein
MDAYGLAGRTASARKEILLLSLFKTGKSTASRVWYSRVDALALPFINVSLRLLISDISHFQLHNRINA